MNGTLTNNFRQSTRNSLVKTWDLAKKVLTGSFIGLSGASGSIGASWADLGIDGEVGLTAILGGTAYMITHHNKNIEPKDPAGPKSDDEKLKLIVTDIVKLRNPNLAPYAATFDKDYNQVLMDVYRMSNASTVPFLARAENLLEREKSTPRTGRVRSLNIA